MAIKAVIGGQWGDEGKGKIVDLLCVDAQLVARFQGGANAGHTVFYGEKKIVLHQVPSGVLTDKCKCILGNGMVVDPIDLVDELQMLEDNGISKNDSIFIAMNAHIVTPVHRWIDSKNEESTDQKIGTTCKGIGPAYVDKYNRCGIRALDLLDIDSLKSKVIERLDRAIESSLLKENDRSDIISEIDCFISAAKKISHMIEDTFSIIHEMSDSGSNILLEGAQGTLLDVNHGTYPFVTSSSPSSGGISTGLGLPLTKVNQIIGIFKAYTTRVGKGPFPTELFDSDGDKLTDIGKEYGATTGRRRRCGWFDAVAAKYSVLINGFTEIALTKLDILDNFDEIKICTHYVYNNQETSQMSKLISNLEEVHPKYKSFKGWNKKTTGISSFEELPVKTQDYIEYISNYIGVPIKIISIGPGKNEIIFN